MSDLATTAERKQRTYIDKNGRLRIIKGRPAKKGLLPLGESTIWDKVRKGEFPQPIRLSPHLTVWNVEEVLAWVESKKAGVIK